ncbi:MAG: TolC family protein, partial [Bradyrhizobium sp.]|nr:TolC family protein [Bradyrhizobium sp.]
PSGYARTMRLWRRGEPIEAAKVIFAAENSQSVWVRAGIDRSVTPARVWFTEGLDFFNHHLWLGDASGAGIKLDLPTDCWMTADGNFMAVKLRQPWTVGDVTHGADVVLGIRLSAFLDGARDFVRVFEPGPRRALQGLCWAGGRLVLSILDELKPQSEVWTPSAQGWSCQRLPGLPELATVNVWPLDAYELTGNGDYQSAALVSLFQPHAAFFSLAGSLTQPIFDGGRILGNFENAKARQDELLQTYRKTVIQAFTDVNNALFAIKQTTIRLQLQRQVVAASRRAFELSEQQLRAGTADIVTVLNTQLTLFQAEDALWQAQLARLQAFVSLYQALGGGWEPRMEKSADAL